ncbi:hypothetical protein JCM6882_001196 [Rhodosporidiobolus microsporus]
MGFMRKMSLQLESPKSGSLHHEKNDAGEVVVTPVDALEEQRVENDEVDGVFGAQGGDDTLNYRSLSWPSAAVILTKAQIGIGVLSIPGSFHVLGLIPGIILLVVFGAVTTWSDYYLGVFKLKHPQVYSLSDCGYLIGGPVVGEIFGAAYFLFMVFTVGSALLTLSTALNAISMHGTCTAVFVAVAAIAVYPIASLRTLNKIKWLGWIGIVSIVSAILLVTISIPAGGRPSLAPQTGPLDLDIKLFGDSSFADAMNSVVNLFWAFSGTPGFLPVASEMRDPRDYRKAVIACQSFVVSFYAVVGIVVYVYAGQYVASPALGTAGVLIKRISYGLALPGLFFTGVYYVHLPAKWIFVRILRNSYHLTHSTPTHWAVWLGCTFGCLMFAYIIASAIPVFNGLLGLIGALFSVLLALIAESMMWLWDNDSRFKDKKQRTPLLWAGVITNWVFILCGAFLIVGGTFGSILTIRDAYATNRLSPWSCQDNSNSV